MIAAASWDLWDAELPSRTKYSSLLRIHPSHACWQSLLRRVAGEQRSTRAGATDYGSLYSALRSTEVETAIDFDRFHSEWPKPARCRSSR